MDYSRSQRIVWLLEELNLPFELKTYAREKDFRAPKSLEKIHPLGKSPVIEIVKPNGDRQVIAETGHIINHILQYYDPNHILTPEEPLERDEVDYFLHYSEGTLQPNLVALLVHSFAKKQAPFGTRTLMGLLVKGIDDQFYFPETKKNLDFLDAILAKQKQSGSKYFVGKKLTGADIILSFPLLTNIFGSKESAQKMGFGNIDKLWPNISAWAENISKEPKFIKANDLVASFEVSKPNI
ncbi:glutathione S-transferase [Acetobacter pasteurianus]|nr:glutathione S-transferase [Acetobacter pasteurianus]